MGLVAFGVLIFGLGIWIPGYHWLAHLSWLDSRFKRIDDSSRNGSSGPVENQRLENFRVVLRFVFRAGVRWHRISAARTLCSSPAASRSRGGA